MAWIRAEDRTLLEGEASAEPVAGEINSVISSGYLRLWLGRAYLNRSAHLKLRPPGAGPGVWSATQSELCALLQRIAVGHSGDVVAGGSPYTVPGNSGLGFRSHGLRVLNIILEKLAHQVR